MGGAERPRICEKNCGPEVIATVTRYKSVWPVGQVWLLEALTVTPPVPSTNPYWATTAFASESNEDVPLRAAAIEAASAAFCNARESWYQATTSMPRPTMATTTVAR